MKRGRIRRSRSLGRSSQPEGHPVLQSHEYERGGTAKLLTLFRPSTGILNVKGVLSVTNAVLHPWLKGELAVMLAEIEQTHPAAQLPPEAQRALCAQWNTWLWPQENAQGLPPLRIILVLDNLAGHLSYDLVKWFFAHGVMPLYTPVGGSWLNMAESVQRIIVPRALAGQYPRDARAYHRLVGTNCAGLERAPYPVCLEWQAPTATRTRSLTPPRWLWCCLGQRVFTCQLTH